MAGAGNNAASRRRRRRLAAGGAWLPPRRHRPRRRPPPPPAAPPPAAAPRTPERIIAEGQAALSRRDYAAAETAAREVLATRNAPRAADAQLLLADALAGKRDHAGAALAYNDAYVRGRTSPRAPDALLGLANSFANLGHKREACDTLDDLRGNYPNLRRRRRSGRRTRAAAPAATPTADDGAAGAFEHVRADRTRQEAGISRAGRSGQAVRGWPEPALEAEFDALMAPLGPFGAAPRLAAGVSGGPHSLALALLAADWARRRGGDLLALVVDHGLRPESGGGGRRASSPRSRARHRGPDAAARPAAGSRACRSGRGQARLAAMLEACAETGRPWLLLGHHRADQAETVLFRALRGSGAGRPRGHGAGAGGSRRPWCCAPCSAWRRRGWGPWSPPPASRRCAIRPTPMPASPAPDCARPWRTRPEPARRSRRWRRPRRRSGAAARTRKRRSPRAWPPPRASTPRAMPRSTPRRSATDGIADAALAALLRAVGGAERPPPAEAARRLRLRGGGTLSGAWLRRAAAAAAGGSCASRARAVGPAVPARAGASGTGGSA